MSSTTTTLASLPPPVLATSGHTATHELSAYDGTQLAPFKTNANYFDPRLPRERSLTGNSCLKCTTNRYRIKINSRIDGTQLAPFKTNANYFDPRLPRERSLTGNSCLKCTTNRYRIKTENDVSLSALGLANILRVPLQNRGDENLISRSFYYA
ncbi:unnamed protein product, partial [Medioppia subpectinata]